MMIMIDKYHVSQKDEPLFAGLCLKTYALRTEVDYIIIQPKANIDFRSYAYNFPCGNYGIDTSLAGNRGF